MKVYHAGKVAMACLGIAFPMIGWSRTVQAQVKLEHKFPEGKKLTYKTTYKTHQTLTLMGMEIESGEDRSIVTSITTGKRRADLALPVERKVESLHVDLSLPGGIRASYDTSSPNAKIDIKGLTFLDDVFRLEAAVAYTVVLDGHNKVKAIEGTEKLKEKVEKLDPRSQAMVRNEFEADTFKRSFEQDLQILPDVLARSGEPWERTQVVETDNGQSISFRKKFEYLGTLQKGDKMLDKIGSKVLEVKYATDPNSNLDLKILKSDLKAESSEGTILFDREAGHVVSINEKVRIRGKITLSAKGMDVPADLDVNIETTVELQPGVK